MLREPSIFDYHGNLNEYNRDMNAYEFYKKMEEQQGSESDIVGIIDEISKACKQIKQIRIARGKMFNDIAPISQMIVENTDEEIIYDVKKFELVHDLFKSYYQNEDIPEIVDYMKDVKLYYDTMWDCLAECDHNDNKKSFYYYRKMQTAELKFIKFLVNQYLGYTDPTNKFYRGLAKFIKIGSMVLIFGILLCFILTTIMFK